MSAVVAARIPADWSDVDAAWMQSVLAGAFPDVDVRDVSLRWRSDGSNRRARFDVRDASHTAPRSVFVKAEGAHRETHARNGNLFNEPRLLGSQVVLPLTHPQPFAVLIDEVALDWLVVMEDVTAAGGDPRDGTRPLTPVQVVDGVRGLARLHARFWGCSADDPTLRWLQTWAPTAGFQLGLRRCVPTGLTRGAGHLPAEIAARTADEVVDLWARYVGRLHRAPVTLLHADAHVGNTYVLPDGRVGFLDWQVARRGNWSQDVGHFVQGALVTDERRRSEGSVVDAYLRELDRDLDRDDAWTWYRASALYGLAIWLSTLGTDGYQPREVSLALATRFATAVVDLDAVDALEALERAG